MSGLLLPAPQDDGPCKDCSRRGQCQCATYRAQIGKDLGKLAEEIQKQATELYETASGADDSGAKKDRMDAAFLSRLSEKMGNTATELADASLEKRTIGPATMNFIYWDSALVSYGFGKKDPAKKLVEALRRSIVEWRESLKPSDK